MTIKYYNDNADSFFADTVHVDMSELHRRFTDYLPKKAHILDAGCGSGRDSLFFINQGFSVDAFDASEGMVAKASELTGLDVQLKRFDQVNVSECYDGLWTCASLLHVPRDQLYGSMNALYKALKHGGIWYLSFKHGTGEREKEGRLFTDMDELALLDLIDKVGGLHIVDMWISADKRPDRDEKWLNAIVRKC